VFRLLARGQPDSMQSAERNAADYLHNEASDVPAQIGSAERLTGRRQAGVPARPLSSNSRLSTRLAA
jgi:hypothetical protein